MTKDEFFRVLRQRLDWPDLSEATPLKGNEKWDSLAQVDVVMAVQEELGETLSTEALQKVATGRELLGLVDGKLG
ncbi:MAG TPA: acyl carrier protein [Candidatus Limnocylindria bacterium]|jgi:acyl carrier protein